MSNHCQGCRYRPEQRSGPQACPMTVLYWAFLDRHEATLAANPRTRLMVTHLARMDAAAREALRTQAQALLQDLDAV